MVTQIDTHWLLTKPGKIVTGRQRKGMSRGEEITAEPKDDGMVVISGKM